MTNDFDTRADQSNLPCDCVKSSLPKDLDAMSAVELAEEMERVWSSMTEDTYDDAVICAYLDALDRKAPMPEMPDAETAYTDFQQLLRDALAEGLTNIEEFDIFALSAIYESSSGEHLAIDIMRYANKPNVQIEKNDAPVEMFDIKGVTIFLIENNVNYTLAWVTEHYECFIFGSNPDILREMANSIFE